MNLSTEDRMLLDGVTPSEVWPTADLAVTFLDGKTIIYADIRYLAVLGYSNPVVIDGTTVQIESEGGMVFTLLGVRQLVFGD